MATRDFVTVRVDDTGGLWHQGWPVRSGDVLAAPSGKVLCLNTDNGWNLNSHPWPSEHDKDDAAYAPHAFQSPTGRGFVHTSGPGLYRVGPDKGHRLGDPAKADSPFEAVMRRFQPTGHLWTTEIHRVGAGDRIELIGTVEARDVMRRSPGTEDFPSNTVFQLLPARESSQSSYLRWWIHNGSAPTKTKSAGELEVTDSTCALMVEGHGPRRRVLSVTTRKGCTPKDLERLLGIAIYGADHHEGYGEALWNRAAAIAWLRKNRKFKDSHQSLGAEADVSYGKRLTYSDVTLCEHGPFDDLALRHLIWAHGIEILLEAGVTNQQAKFIKAWLYIEYAVSFCLEDLQVFRDDQGRLFLPRKCEALPDPKVLRWNVVTQGYFDRTQIWLARRHGALLEHLLLARASRCD